MTATLIDDKDLWDEFVESSPYGLLFHKWDFLKIIEKYSGCKLLPYGAYHGNKLSCVLPFFYVRNTGLKLLYSPPQINKVYVPYLGFVMSPEFDTLPQQMKESQLFEAIDDIHRAVKKIRPNHITFETVPKFLDIRPFKWGGYKIKTNYTYILDLTRPIEEIWEGFNRNCRRNIQNCNKLNLSLKQVSDPDMFFSLMKKRLSNQGLTFFHCQDSTLLKDVLATFPDNVKMIYLYDDSAITDIIVTIEFHGRVITWMGARVVDHVLNTDEYLHWMLIKKAKAEGYKEYENWGGDTERLNPFKSKFNPTLHITYSLYRDDKIGTVANWGYEKMQKNKLLNSLRNRLIKNN